MAKHEGIRQRPDGRWEFRTRVDGVRRSFYAPTFGEAQDLKATKLHQKTHNLVAKASHHTVGTFLEQWLKEVAEPSVRNTTKRQYAQHIKLYLAPKRTTNGIQIYRPLPNIGGVRLTKLTPQMVQRWVNYLLKKPKIRQPRASRRAEKRLLSPTYRPAQPRHPAARSVAS